MINCQFLVRICCSLLTVAMLSLFIQPEFLKTLDLGVKEVEEIIDDDDCGCATVVLSGAILELIVDVTNEGCQCENVPGLVVSVESQALVNNHNLRVNSFRHFFFCVSAGDDDSEVPSLLTGNPSDFFHLEPCDVKDTSDIETNYCVPNGLYAIGSMIFLIEFQEILIPDPNGIIPIIMMVEFPILLDKDFKLIDISTRDF